MKFGDFWPLYLKAHRLPGTRALHYFATALGIICAVEAVVAQRPLVFVVGIAASYAIAIAAHWLVEGNRPLISVNAFFGAIADIRMCWLALNGRMGKELARSGALQQTSQIGELARKVRGAEAATHAQHRIPSVLRLDRQYARYALLIASAAGLACGMADLSDLAEPMGGFAHPILQLGAPIVAFAGALIAAIAAIVTAQQYARLVGDGAAQSRHMAAIAATSRGGDAEDRSINERSLRRACLALLTLGSIAFGLAELAEHGLPESVRAYGAAPLLPDFVTVVGNDQSGRQLATGPVPGEMSQNITSVVAAA